jgi:hypothetical protein
MSFDRRDAAILVLVFGVWTAWGVLARGTLGLAVVDDAYIYLRVVDNIIAGKGWTYNAHNSVNPLTSPLFPLLLIPLRFIGLDAIGTLWTAYGLGILAIAVLQYLAFRHEGRLLATVMALTTASGGVLMRSAGMETSIFLACILASALAYQRNRPLLAGVLAGAAALARPEGVALIAVLSAVHLLRTRRVPARMLIGWALPVLPWLAYSYWSFGSILPHTVSIKAIQSGIGYWAEQPAWLRTFLRQARVLPLTMLLFVIGVANAWSRCLQGDPFALVVVGFGCVQVTAYAVLGAPAGYFWYYAPGNLAIDTGVILGLFWVGHYIRRYSARSGPIEPLSGWRAVAAGTVVVALMTQLGATQARMVEPYRLAAEYLNAGRWIDANLPPDVRVACTEIGYLGYYSQREIRDMHGLIHREAVEPLRRAQWDWWFASDPPEVIVVHNPRWYGEPAPAYWRQESLRRFEKDYRSVYTNGSIEIFVRVDVREHAT